MLTRTFHFQHGCSANNSFNMCHKCGTKTDIISFQQCTLVYANVTPRDAVRHNPTAIMAILLSFRNDRLILQDCVSVSNVSSSENRTSPHSVTSQNDVTLYDSQRALLES